MAGTFGVLGAARLAAAAFLTVSIGALITTVLATVFTPSVLAGAFSAVLAAVLTAVFTGPRVEVEVLEGTGVANAVLRAARLGATSNTGR